MGLWTNLEAQDDGPNETERQARVAVDDVVGAHVLQMHALLEQEAQRLVHVLQAVDPHLALGGARLYKRLKACIHIALRYSLIIMQQTSTYNNTNSMQRSLPINPISYFLQNNLGHERCVSAYSCFISDNVHEKGSTWEFKWEGGRA
jgi:hypothetical protein